MWDWFWLAFLVNFATSSLTGFVWIPDQKTFSGYNIFWFCVGGPIIWFMLGLLWMIHKWNDYEIKKHRRENNEKF